MEAVIATLPDTGVIPRYGEIRQMLYDLIVPQKSISSMLISYIYFSHCREPIERDIWVQASWCADRVNKFGRLAKTLKASRNKLEHNLHFPIALFKKLVLAAFAFHNYQSDAFTWKITADLVSIVQIIVGDEEGIKPVSNPDAYCPLCRRGKECVDETKTFKKEDYTENEGIIRVLKEIHGKEMKHYRVEILDGIHQGKKGDFVGWNGTNCYILLDGGKKEHFSLARRVRIIGKSELWKKWEAERNEMTG